MNSDNNGDPNVDTGNWIVLSFYSDEGPDLEHYTATREGCEAWICTNVKAPTQSTYAIVKIDTVVRSGLVWSKTSS